MVQQSLAESWDLQPEHLQDDEHQVQGDHGSTPTRVIPLAGSNLRLLWRVKIEDLMKASGQNLKQLLKKRGWGRCPFPAEAMYALFLALCSLLVHLVGLSLLGWVRIEMVIVRGEILSLPKD